MSFVHENDGDNDDKRNGLEPECFEMNLHVQIYSHRKSNEIPWTICDII